MQLKGDGVQALQEAAGTEALKGRKSLEGLGVKAGIPGLGQDRRFKGRNGMTCSWDNEDICLLAEKEHTEKSFG